MVYGSLAQGVTRSVRNAPRYAPRRAMCSYFIRQIADGPAEEDQRCSGAAGGYFKDALIAAFLDAKTVLPTLRYFLEIA